MENLNAENVKKALECCNKGTTEDCAKCPRFDGDRTLSTEDCMEKLMRDALSLINSQEQRIKELAAKVADLQDELKCEKETNAHLSSQYMSENHLRHQAEEMLANGMSEVKADTVRKIADLLWQGESEKLNISVGGKYYDKQEFIDQIAKELLECENER